LDEELKRTKKLIELSKKKRKTLRIGKIQNRLARKKQISFLKSSSIEK